MYYFLVFVSSRCILHAHDERGSSGEFYMHTTRESAARTAAAVAVSLPPAPEDGGGLGGLGGGAGDGGGGTHVTVT
jgi:uncharacterized membrane protein